jgi:hypothetical protein
VSDAKPDVPPPRYEQVGDFQHLICDEQEWLARPALWGIDKLPDEVRGRKQSLFNAHFQGWLAGFIQCPECGSRVRQLIGNDESWFDDNVLAEWDGTPHPAGACDADGILRGVCNYHRGLITYAELHNLVWDGLYGNFDLRVLRAGGTGSPALGERAARRTELALELVGPNPFRPVAFSPAWRTDTAVSLAQQMYEARDFSAMPILADALQDAGCDNEAILSHCRDATQPHVRGCWVVDLVLGKA